MLFLSQGCKMTKYHLIGAEAFRSGHIKAKLAFFARVGLICAGLIVLSLTTSSAGQSCCGVGGGWDPSSFLNSDEVPGALPTNMGSLVVGDGSTRSNAVGLGAAGFSKASSNESSEELHAEGSPLGYQPVYRSDSFPDGQMLKYLLSLSSSDLVIDVSSGQGYDRTHIKGAIHLPARSFIHDNGTLRSVQELSSILGAAGVSRDDSVVVYSDDLSSGEATFAFFVLKYMGHESVKLLDGGIEEWTLTHLPVEADVNIRPETNYTASPDSGLLAKYDLVKAGSAQILDARAYDDFAKGRVTNATFLGKAGVLNEGLIQGSIILNQTFSSLSKDLPVIVYSDDGFEASLVWYALKLMGYDSRLYTWSDWEAHNPSIKPLDLSSSRSDLRQRQGLVSNGDRFKKLGRT
jgi:3-mercaptopyruvate sulfurtransferase SseA